MRNTVVQTLPPGSTLTINVDPPIADDERHYVITALGIRALEVEVVDTRRVSLTNRLGVIVPFVFLVGPKTFLPPSVRALARFLGDL
jgi:hypothetical protein